MFRSSFLFLFIASLVAMLLQQGCVSEAEGTTASVVGNVSTVGRVAWMELVPSTTPLCKLSIPGTHDSGATRGGVLVETQKRSIAEQLEMGIRAFDIRLQCRGDKLGLYHGIAYQGITWEDYVLPTFIAFLQQHPTEMLVVSLKREGGKAEKYSEMLAESLCQESLRKYLVPRFDPALTLGDCRGKILFVHRDYVMDDFPGATTTGWKDNATTLLTLHANDGVSTNALLEDEYSYQSINNAPDKVKAVLANLDRVARERAESQMWGVTYLSATALVLGSPKEFAKRVNVAVAEALQNAPRDRRYGILFMDFVGQPAAQAIVARLIASNTLEKTPLIVAPRTTTE